MKLAWVVAAAAALIAVAPASAQTEATPSAPAAAVAEAVTAEATPAAPTIRIPAGTIVHVELTEALSSQSSQQGQTFGLRLVSPIVIDGREVVPAGAAGGGEVIDVARSAFGGRQGRLIISGRFIEIGGQQQRIRGMQITAVGDERGNEALAVSMIPYAGIAGIFIQGGAIEIPAGARGTARLANDVDVVIADAAPAPADSVAPQVNQGENQE